MKNACGFGGALLLCALFLALSQITSERRASPVEALPTARRDSRVEPVPQRGVTAWVFGVAFSPDSQRFAVAERDVSLWRTQSGECERRFETSTLRMEAVAWSPDGARLAAGGLTFETGVPRGVVYLWDTRSGQLLRQWMTGHASITCVAWSPDGQTLATATGGDGEGRSEQGGVTLWDAASGRLLRTLATYDAERGWVRWSRDGRRIEFDASSDYPDGGRGGFGTYYAASGQKTSRLTPGEMLSPFITPNQMYNLEVRNNDSADIETPPPARTEISLRRLFNQTVVAQLTLPSHCYSAALSPDGQWLAAGESSANSVPLRIWHLDKPAKTWQPVHSLEAENTRFNRVAFAEGQTLAIGEQRGLLLRWDLQRGQFKSVRRSGEFKLPLSRAERQLAASGFWNGYGTAFSSDGARLADREGIADTRTGARQPFEESSEMWPGYIEKASFSADGALLLSAYPRTTPNVLHLWNGKTGKFLRTLKVDGSDKIVTKAIVFAPRGHNFAAVCDRGNGNFSLLLINADTGVTVRRFRDFPPLLAETMRFSPDGKTLAVSGYPALFSRYTRALPKLDDKPLPSLIFWDAASGRRHGSLPIFGTEPPPFAWINNHIVVALVNGEARFYDVVTQKLLAKLMILNVQRGADKTSIEWLVTTPDGAFDISRGGYKYLRWRSGEELSANPPRSAHRVPGLLAKVIA